MKKRFIPVMVLSLALVFPAFAAENEGQRKGAGPNFENRKAEVLKNIDERIDGMQQLKACVQAAKNHEDMKSCREKFGPHGGPGAQREGKGQRGPGGANRGGPGGPASPQGQ